MRQIYSLIALFFVFIALAQKAYIFFSKNQKWNTYQSIASCLLPVACCLLPVAFYYNFLFVAPARAQATKYYAPPPSYSNASLTGKDFSGQTIRSGEFSNANLELTNFSNADLRGSIFSASVMTNSNLHGADFSYGMADQVNFTDADLSDAIFQETIMLSSLFNNTNISGADFTDAILDRFQIKQLCTYASGVNSKTGVKTRDSLGCK